MVWDLVSESWYYTDLIRVDIILWFNKAQVLCGSTVSLLPYWFCKLAPLEAEKSSGISGQCCWPRYFPVAPSWTPPWSWGEGQEQFLTLLLTLLFHGFIYPRAISALSCHPPISCTPWILILSQVFSWLESTSSLWDETKCVQGSLEGFAFVGTMTYDKFNSLCPIWFSNAIPASLNLKYP